MRVQALRPLRSSRQLCSTPTPRGETRPMPVTTTRRIAGVLGLPETPLCSGRSLVDVLHRVADGQDGFGGVVGDLDPEFLFERHDEFDRVEAVGAEIIDEARLLGYLLGVDAEMLDDDLLDALCGVTHLGILALLMSAFVSRRNGANQVERYTAQGTPRSLPGSWRSAGLRGALHEKPLR